jgi:hypothetical protein
MKKVLLYSGGMDSWLIDKIWKPDVKLYIDINGRYSKQEISRLPKDVIIEKLDLSKFEREDKIIPMRNLFFVTLASLYGDEICLGATAGDRVLDKSFEFAQKSSDLLSYLWQEQHWTNERKIKINVDFKKYSKLELLELYKKNGGDIEKCFKETFSCYYPDDTGKECWSCKPCFRKVVAFVLAGMKIENSIKEKIAKYIEKEILPLIKKGIYGRGKEEDEIIKAYHLIRGDLKNDNK